MAYPPYLARTTHFEADANEGIDSPSPSGVDAELDDIHTVTNEINLDLRRITHPDGRLKNLAAATAMALAGADNITATASQTDFVTDIDWDSNFSTASVVVFISGLFVVPASVQDDGAGKLEVTLTAQSAGTVVYILAFSAGAGILTRLSDTSNNEGADLVAIEDAGGYTSQVTVEAALQELFSHTQGAAGKTWLEGVLAMSDYLKLTGGTMTGDITMSASKTVKGLRASAANGEAVRHEQFITLQNTMSGLTSTFMPKSGGTFTGAVNFGSQTTTGVATPTTSDAIASKGYVDTTLASFGGLPVGSLIDFAGSVAPTGWLLCDGAAVSRTTYSSLFAVIGVTWGVGDAATTFNVPDLRGRGTIGSGSGSGLTTRTLAQSGGEETHTIAEAELPAHTHFMLADVDSSSNVTASTTVARQWTATASDEAYTLKAPGSATAATIGLTSSVGSGTPITNMHPYAVATKIIKY